jgi:hypothetical protein
MLDHSISFIFLIEMASLISIEVFSPTFGPTTLMRNFQATALADGSFPEENLG